jgi:flagellum-specific peptidoglycan hydrolase FlgJ
MSCSSQITAIQTTKTDTSVTSISKKNIKNQLSKKSTVDIAIQKPVAVQTSNKTIDSSNTSNTEILVSTSRTKVTLQTIADYVLQYKDIAMNNMRNYGIPASIILAQGILESGAGSGDLAQSANNHFGIKCHKDWTGESVRHDDDAAQECFRKYPKPSESFQDHAIFLTSRGRYSKLFKLDKNDYKSWARGLRASGYATDPRYPEKLITYIEKYNLSRYDNEVLGIENIIIVPIINNEIFVYNENLELYEIQKGDTLYSISKKFSISVDELRSLNKITDNAIAIGQKIKTK